MTTTKPTGEQLRFRSAKTGDHDLDAYLEAAELGNRTLPDLLSDVFTSEGAVRGNLIELRITAEGQLQYRFGTYANPSAGWLDIANGEVFRVRGPHLTATIYKRLDIVTYNNGTYACVNEHMSSSVVPSATNFVLLFGADIALAAAVRHDSAQSLTSGAQLQARTNIGALAAVSPTFTGTASGVNLSLSGSATVSGPTNLTGNLTANFTTLNGLLTVNANARIGDGSTGSFADLIGAAGSLRYLRFFTGSAAASGLRFGVGLSSAAESGADAGSNLTLQSYSDTGTLLRTDLSLTRATGEWSFGGTLRPSSNNAHALGLSTHRFSNLWTVDLNASGTITGASQTLSGDLTVSGVATFSSALNGATISTTGSATIGGTLTAQSSAAVNGTLTVGTGTGAATLALSGAAGSNRQIPFYSGAVTAANLRWNVVTNAVAESGANAGSNFQINAHTDAGALIGSALSIERATRAVSVGTSLSVGSTLDVNGATTLASLSATSGAFSSALTVSGLFTAGANARIGDTGSASYADIAGAAASERFLRFWTGGFTAANMRWRMGANSVAESGSNAGSNFTIASLSDTGTLLRSDLLIDRATGAWTIAGAVTLNSTLDVTGALNATGAISSSSTVTAAGSARITGNAGTVRGLWVYSGAVATANQRWLIQGNATAEGGSNAGTNLDITAYSDTGTVVGTALRITRSSLAAQFFGNLTTNGTFTCASSGTFDGNVTIGDAASATDFTIRGAAATARQIRFMTGAASLRWVINANSTAESGGGAGTNLDFTAYGDAGAIIGTAFRITRSTLDARFFADLTVDGALTAGGSQVITTAGNGLTKSTATLAIDTNNGGGVGSYYLARNSSGSTVNNNATTAGSNLRAVIWNGSAWVDSAALSGTWRNVSGQNMPNTGFGLFIRTA